MIDAWDEARYRLAWRIMLPAQSVQIGSDARDLSNEELEAEMESGLKELLNSGSLAIMLARLGWRVEPRQSNPYGLLGQELE